MTVNAEFKFEPHPITAFRDAEVLERMRHLTREEMLNYTKSKVDVRIVADGTPLMVADMFARIKQSDERDEKFVMIMPNPWFNAYRNVALLCNQFRVSTRNVHTYCMDEFANADGEVAPITYKYGLGYANRRDFFAQIDPDLRMPEEQSHYFTTENYKDISKMIEDDGGADVCYSAPGWPAHVAFVDPDTEAFGTDSLDEFLQMGSRFVMQHPLTVAENSLFKLFGSSGDVAAVPPAAVTVGPKDMVNTRFHIQMHQHAEASGSSWQRMVSRLVLFGPVTPQVPASILQLFPGRCYMSEAIAAPFEYND